jgi:hypothetical protein
MNTKEFIKALRAVIREEVRTAVRQEMSAILVETKQPQKSHNQKQVISNKQTPVKTITGNPILDQVLSETTLTPEFRQSADVGYDNFSFTTDDVKAPVSMMNMDIVDDIEQDLPPSTSTLPFMKDYSQLMKKADAISAQKQF